VHFVTYIRKNELRYIACFLIPLVKFKENISGYYFISQVNCRGNLKKGKFAIKRSFSIIGYFKMRKFKVPLLSANVFVEISSLQKSESYTNGLLRL